MSPAATPYFWICSWRRTRASQVVPTTEVGPQEGHAMATPRATECRWDEQTRIQETSACGVVWIEEEEAMANHRY